MLESKSKEKMLKKIRAALIHKSPNRFPNLDFDSPIFNYSAEAPEIEFATQFTKVNGHFVFCQNIGEFLESFAALASERGWNKVFVPEPQIQKLFNEGSLPFTNSDGDLEKSPAAVTGCECLVSRTGTILVSSRTESGRRAFAFPDHHIVVAWCHQIVSDLKDGFKKIKDAYPDKAPSMIAAITGPSRTADIEKTLVQGAHGPKEIYVFLLDG